MLYQVKDIADYNKEESKMMLSNHASDFWKPYRDNYNYFDRLFMKLYRSWYPMDQEGDLEEVATDFTFDVKAWLIINDKRYSELFRAYDIPDDTAYSLTNNVDYTETIERGIDRSGTNDKGQQINSESGSAVYASHTDERDISFTKGLGSVTTTNSTSASNESTFTPVDMSAVNDSIRNDTTSDDITYGAHTDTTSGSATEGARHDAFENSEDMDQTRHLVGNYGVQTVDDMIKKHVFDVWIPFEFYMLVFNEIAAHLLKGVI